MLREEFEKLCGVKIPPGHYAEIEKIYMAIPDAINISKADFARCYAGTAESVVSGLLSWLYAQLLGARLDAEHYKAVFGIACASEAEAKAEAVDLRGKFRALLM